MAIDFTPARWQKVRSDAAQWWAGKLKRPLIQILMNGHDPGLPEPKIPSQWFLPQYPASVTAEQIADRWEYDLSSVFFLGDAFPSEWLNYGAGILAGFTGCGVHADDSTVWFTPPWAMEIPEIELKFDPKNPWFRRISEVARITSERFKDRALIGMTDIGGSLDILSSFRPSERLLLDLVDYPEDVERLVWKIHELWFQYHEHFQSILNRGTRGSTCWTSMYSDVPYYMYQCDFCYMISPEMFDRFVLPDLAAACRKIPNPFYHLDGIGELPHLDSILSIKELKGVQWIPGAGKPDAGYWPEVIGKIRKAGKLAQFFGTPESMDHLADKLGSVEGCCLICQNTFAASEEKRIEKFLLKHGVI